MFKWLTATAVVTAGLALVLMLLVTTTSTASQASAAPSGGPSVQALDTIPATYLALYLAAAQTCPACRGRSSPGIGKVESDHGQSDAPGVHSGANYAGAEGPMQFEAATFTHYAVNADRPAPLTPYNPADAIYTAAAMLCASGAAAGTSAGIRQAVFAYNHSQAYVTAVLAWAARYTAPALSSAAATATAFAVRQVGKPYQWGATGPDAYDCSGLVVRRLRRGGHHHRPHHLPVAPGRPPDPAVPDPARRPAVLRRLGRHPLLSGFRL